MIKEAIGTGETIEEAKENALISLGADITTDIEFEVLETPKKKTLGLFGGNPAKVRVFTEIPDEKPVQKPEVKKPAAAPKTVSKQAPKAETPAPKRTDVKTVSSSAESPAQSQIVPAAEINFIPAEQVDPNTPIGRAVTYLKNVLSAMDVQDVTMKVGEIEGGHQIDLFGSVLGVVIGRRGETLDALQYLVSLAANNGENYTRVVLNTGNYREKREQTLQSLAARVSSQVLRTGRSRSLEPMNPYERRVIHTAVQKIEGVNSNSIGDGANRRVVISSVGSFRGGNKGGYNNNNNRQGGYRKDTRGGTNNRSHNTRRTDSAPTANRAPKSDIGDSPLYGKIDLNK